MAGYTFVGDEAAEEAGDQAQSFIELIYETADGWMAVSAHTDSTWKGLARAVGRPDWLDDPRFATVALREINKPARLELTQSALIEDTTANWMERLTAEDVPCAPVLTRAEMIRHPQVAANGIVIETDHPEAGRIRQARTPARFEDVPVAPPRPAQKLGADTEAVLAEIGYTGAEIAALIEAGVATGPQEGEP
jgi:crotonobetainyl-CoA:carnitine CoA-transferase CaiB-like acyl-CoA transferase